MKYSKYPYAPLLPMTAVGELERAAVAYGVGLGIDANQTPKSDRTERDGDRTVWLTERLRADARQLEFGPLEAVAR